VAVVEHHESQLESGTDLRTRIRASAGFERAGWRSSCTRHNRRCTRRRVALAGHAVPSLAGHAVPSLAGHAVPSLATLAQRG
jgi:hypothetical protein